LFLATSGTPQGSRTPFLYSKFLPGEYLGLWWLPRLVAVLWSEVTMSFRSEVIAAARAAGGSFKTIQARMQMGGQLANYLQSQNIQIRHLGDLKEKHIAGWIKSSKDAGISDRSCQNRLTTIRGCLRAVDLDRKADALQTAKFGVQNASRDGSRTAISLDVYRERLALVKDEGVRAALALQRELGLRQKEAVMVRLDTLNRWEKEIQRDSTVSVVEGTKGGRARQTLLHNPDAALQVIRHAKSIADAQRGRLVRADGLKEAIDRFNNQARAAGFVGKESPHSLRYAWAQDRIKAYLIAGVSRREALVCTSHDLGHGDGRGRWVDRVYSR